MEDIQRKRAQIANIIENLAQEEHGGSLQLPALQYESPVRSTSVNQTQNSTVLTSSGQESGATNYVDRAAESEFMAIFIQLDLFSNDKV